MQLLHSNAIITELNAIITQLNAIITQLHQPLHSNAIITQLHQSFFRYFQHLKQAVCNP